MIKKCKHCGEKMYYSYVEQKFVCLSCGYAEPQKRGISEW